jgi:hypothetical protein
MFSFKHRGNFNNTERFLNKAGRLNYRQILDRYAGAGVRALSSATPIDTGLTKTSWDYYIKVSSKYSKIVWTNSHIENGVPIAIILQYGHGTKNGGFVQGRDYINPAIRPIFDSLAEDLWREVLNS